MGFSRSIVDPTPGTTRDVVSFTASFAGWPVELADTAGVRRAVDPIEALGVERSLREQEQADLVLLVVDRSQPLQPIDREFVATHPAALLVGNKSDLPTAWRDVDLGPMSGSIVTVSAATGDGLEVLIEAIVKRLVPEAPPIGAAVPFRQEQVESLRQIKASLVAGDREAAIKELSMMFQRGSDKA